MAGKTKGIGAVKKDINRLEGRDGSEQGLLLGDGSEQRRLRTS